MSPKTRFYLYVTRDVLLALIIINAIIIALAAFLCAVKFYPTFLSNIFNIDSTAGICIYKFTLFNFFI